MLGDSGGAVGPEQSLCDKHHETLGMEANRALGEGLHLEQSKLLPLLEPRPNTGHTDSRLVRSFPVLFVTAFFSL